MIRAWLWHGLLVLALGLAACKGIGSPLVDHEKSDSVKGGTGFCVLAPSCVDDRADDIATLIAPLDASFVDLAACGFRGQICPDAPGEPDPSSDPPPAAGCITGWTAAHAAEQTNRRTFECADLELDLRGAPAHPDPVALGPIDLRSTNLSLLAARPITVELDGAALNDVNIQLAGPITLHILRSRQFQKVRIQNATGDVAMLQLEGIDGADLSVGGTPRFNGQVAISTSTLSNVRIVTDELTVTDSALASCNAQVSTLDAVHPTFNLVTLAFEHGRLEGPSAVSMQITECATLDVITGMIQNTRVVACSEAPLRFYGASAVKVFLDGEIQADHSLFEDVLFGAHERTDLLAWDTQVLTSNFCRYSSTVRLGASVLLVCSSCDDHSTLLACVDETSTREIRNSQCGAFTDPPSCGSGLPDRPRPPI